MFYTFYQNNSGGVFSFKQDAIASMGKMFQLGPTEGRIRGWKTSQKALSTMPMVESFLFIFKKNRLNARNPY
jgi:hypothetical protein